MTSFRFTDVFPRSSDSLKRKEGSLENTLSLVSCQPSGFSSIHTTTTCQCHARTYMCTPLVTSIDLENRGRTNISAGVCSAFLSVVVCVFSINGNGCLASPYPDPEFPLLQISFFKKTPLHECYPLSPQIVLPTHTRADLRLGRKFSTSPFHSVRHLDVLLRLSAEHSRLRWLLHSVTHRWSPDLHGIP